MEKWEMYTLLWKVYNHIRELLISFLYLWFFELTAAVVANF